MAPRDPIELRRNYLREAAHLLAISSPVVASNVGSAQDRLMEAAETTPSPKELAILRRESCGFCGNLFVPGWSCKVINRSEVRKKRPSAQDQRPASINPHKSIVYTCLRCHRETIQQKPSTQVKRHEVGLAAQLVENAINPVQEEYPEARKATNRNSKQRQKTRKGGLLAMLEKNKKTTTASPGFDLMDFAL